MVTLEAARGEKAVAFKGEDLDQPAPGGSLSDTWKIESDILQCKVRDGAPIRLGRGMGLRRVPCKWNNHICDGFKVMENKQA